MSKEKISQYLASNSLDIQNAKAALPVIELALLEFVKSFGELFVYIDFSQTNNFYEIVTVNNLKRVCLSLHQKYKQTKSILSDQIRQHNKLYNNIEQVYQEQKDSDNLLKTYNRLIKVSRPFWRQAVYLEDKGENVFQALKHQLSIKYNLSQREIKEIINILSYPSKSTAFYLERKSFLDICLVLIDKKLSQKKASEVLRDKAVRLPVDAYLKKYFWFKTSFYGIKRITPEIIVNDILLEISRLGHREIAKEYRQLENKFKKINSQKKILLKKYHFSPSELAVLKYLQTIIFWTDKRKEQMIKNCYYIFEVLEKIADRMNLKYSELAFYRIEEVRELLVNKKKLSKNRVKSRLQGEFWVLRKNTKVQVYQGQAAQQLFQQATQVKVKQKLNGLVANQGKTNSLSGVARIVFSLQDKFKAGEILVTSMTRVEVLPLMRLARAIITDEGGIACHAAIISRELGKPCIIGTKNASRILKDGDKVRLNLRTGVINIEK